MNERNKLERLRLASLSSLKWSSSFLSYEENEALWIHSEDRIHNTSFSS
jgi:hypothetical protein